MEKYGICPRCGKKLKMICPQYLWHLPPHNCLGEFIGERTMFEKLNKEKPETKFDLSYLGDRLN